MTNFKDSLEEILKRHKLLYVEEGSITTDQATQSIIDLIDRRSRVTGDTSDGYHTFNELYEFRLLYNACLFNVWANMSSDVPKVVKSWKHSDGEPCFGGGWFVVTAQLPTGQITNHYEAKDWGLFHIPEVETAPEWDGHTPQDVAKRLRELLEGEQRQRLGVYK